MSRDGGYRYVAIANDGRRVKGAIEAGSESAAFSQLKRQGLSPINISPGRPPRQAGSGGTVSEKAWAEFLADMAALLKAGSDIRGSLLILSSRADGSPLAAACRIISSQISGGESVDAAFAKALPAKFAFVAALIAAGEATGDLPGGLARAAELLCARVRLREQLVSALSYPAFVLASTIAAFLIILFFLVPSLAPLADAAAGVPPLTLRLLLAASDLLRGNFGLIIGVIVLGVAALAVMAVSGALGATVDRWLLSGPLRRTSGALVYGTFSVALGDMLAGGAPMTQALRLATRTVRSGFARQRLEPVIAAVRDGQSLSSALDRVPGFPISILRLASVGEASGALGPMMARAGRLEEDAAIRRIEAWGRLLGPAMIIGMGALIGLLMAGLLGSIQQVGELSLQ